MSPASNFPVARSSRPCHVDNDTRGKLIRSQAPGGQQTNDYYDLRGNKVREVTGNNDQPVWSYDYFGHLLSHTDMSGGAYAYTYDKVGHVTQQALVRGSTSATTTYLYYENGEVKKITDTGVAGETYYEYDAAGNRVRERYTKANVVYQDNRISFDALNRITQIKDNRYTITYKYDANGNRREAYTFYYDAANSGHTIDSWYLYDGMNRITLSQGVLSGGTIQINASQGIQLQYDADGNRRVATSYQSGALVTESYDYDDDNRLATTSRGGQQTSARAYDAAGRVTQQTSYSSPGVASEIRANTYNANGQLLQQAVYAGNGTTLKQSTNYTGYDGMGNVTSYQTSVYQGTAYTNYYSYVYAKYDSYKEATVNGSSTYFQAGQTKTTYDINGNALSVSDQFAANRYRSFVTDGSGHILQKADNGQTQYYFYAADKPVGSSGALSAADFDYNYTPVSDEYPAMTPSSYVVSQSDTLRGIALAVFGDAQLWYLIADANGLHSDSDLKVGQQLTIPNRITNLHNDSQTFQVYRPGQIVGDTNPTLPDPPPPPPVASHGGGGDGCGAMGAIMVAVVVIVVAAYTQQYYLLNQAEAMSAAVGATGGDIVGASAVIESGAISSSTMFAAGAMGAAAGNLAGQALGNAIGTQHGFNFGALASATLSGGITAGLLGAQGGWTPLGKSLGEVGRAVAGNLISQGVNIIVDQQPKFSWAAVAGAAVAAAVTQGLSGEAGKMSGHSSTARAGLGAGGSFAAALAGGVAGGVVRATLSGGKLDFVQVAADAFGNALGSSMAERLTGQGGQQAAKLEGSYGSDLQGGLGSDTSPVPGDSPSSIPQARDYYANIPTPTSARMDEAYGTVLSDADTAFGMDPTADATGARTSANIGGLSSRSLRSLFDGAVSAGEAWIDDSRRQLVDLGKAQGTVGELLARSVASNIGTAEGFGLAGYSFVRGAVSAISCGYDLISLNAWMSDPQTNLDCGKALIDGLSIASSLTSMQRWVFDPAGNMKLGGAVWYELTKDYRADLQAGDSPKFVGRALGEAVSLAVGAFELKATIRTFEATNAVADAARAADAAKAGEQILVANSVATPRGPAVQATTAEALNALREVQNGSTVFRQGEFGVQKTFDGQFWALSNPATMRNYAVQLGMPGPAAPKIDWIMGGTVKPGSAVITRPAPAIGGNAGGSMEAVVPAGEVKIQWFHMTD